MIAGHRRSGSGIVVLWCLAIFTWTVALAADAAPAGSSNSCIACHQLQHDKRLRQPAVGLPNDVHFTKGFACQDCHGGDPTGGMAESDPSLAHDSAKGFVGAPTPAQIPEFCARCHSDVERMKQYDPKMRVDQLQEYRSSQHGKKLAQGDAKVATCISCHGVHGILPVADTRSPVYKTNVAATCAHCHADTGYMGPYGIPTNQFKLYRTSVHGSKLLDKGDLGAPTCNNCHGNHGATPPGLTSIAATCGECHANNREFFNQSPHKEAFASLGVGECTACHNHHDIAKPADSLLGVGPGSLCITCHSEGEPGYRAAALMSAKLDSLKTTLHTAHDMLVRPATSSCSAARRWPICVCAGSGWRLRSRSFSCSPFCSIKRFAASKAGRGSV
ncbi:MAG: cytochrome c3 family protein [candidate division Zixibacteria bacterium]|nr:cytochrome c3 family protein [candidate division Zixibacteria bacterium]